MARRRVASTPSSPGICRSITTTSGDGARDDIDDRRAVRRLADELEVRCGREQRPQSVAEYRVVVRDDDTDGHVRPAMASVARTRVPPPSRGTISSVPPSSVARSRIALMPTPDRPARSSPDPSSSTWTMSGPCRVRRTVHLSRRSVVDRVEHRLRRDPVRRHLDGRGQRWERAVDHDLDGHPGRGIGRELGGALTQRLDQAQVVQRRWSQFTGQPADVGEDALGLFLEVGQARREPPPGR